MLVAKSCLSITYFPSFKTPIFVTFLLLCYVIVYIENMYAILQWLKFQLSFHRLGPNCCHCRSRNSSIDHGTINTSKVLRVE